MNHLFAAVAVLAGLTLASTIVLACLILQTIGKLMDVLDDYIAAQQTYNADITADLGTIQATTQNLNTQIAALTAQLAGAGLTQAQTDALTALTTAGQALEQQADTLAGKTPPALPAATDAPATSA